MTNATGTDAWDFSKAVSGTADGAASILKLYARWEKADTSYTVRVWKENLTSTDHEANNAKHENGTVDYLLADFRSISAPTGAVIDVTKDQDIQNYIKEEAGKSSFSTYELQADKTSPDSITVKGDGTSVVNIYFDLKVYTVQFRAFQDGYNGHPGNILFYDTADGSYYQYNFGNSYAVTFEAGGKEYSIGEIYSFQARIGEDISGVWPDYAAAHIGPGEGADESDVSFANSLSPDSWVDESPDAMYNRVIRFSSNTQSVMSKKYISADSNQMTHTYCLNFVKDAITHELHNHYQTLEDLTVFNDNVKRRSSGAKTNWVSSSSAAWTVLDQAPEGYPSTDTANHIWHFYFIRNHITLYYYNYNGLDRVYEGDGTEQTSSSGGWGQHKIDKPGVLYGTPLGSGEYNYTPPRPSGLPENYAFQGWYTREDLSGDPFDFNTTMGGKPLTLYAKWAAVPVTVTFDSNGGSDVPPQTIQYAKSPEKPADPVRKGYTFGGWAYTNGTPFSFSEQITRDTTLVAKWVEFDQNIRVVYDAGDGSGAPTDPSLYSDASCAIVKKAPTAQEGKYFLGWTYDGKTCNYGDVIQLRSSVAKKQSDGTYTITLTAVYGEHKPALLTYYANNGTDQKAQVVLANNSGLKFASADSFLFGLSGYRFTGWNTQADGSGTAYKAGDTAAIDHDTPNRLYAQWEKIPAKEPDPKPETKETETKEPEPETKETETKEPETETETETKEPETETETETKETETEPESGKKKKAQKKTRKSTETETEKTKAVNTGDESHPELYLLICLLSGGLILTSIIYGRKNRRM